MRGLFALTLICCALPALAAPPRDTLLDGFRNPPPSARPRVWWHWMNGNVTRDGIRRDLDWMKRIGIGGVNAIDASIDTPQVVKKRLVYMTPEWQGAFRYAAGLADKYGMELSIDSSPGWSETGGPWVTPQEAMKKLVWSRTAIEGGAPFHGVLPRPPANPGPFQNIARGNAPSFYRDSIVIAYRQAAAAPPITEATSSAGAIGAAALDDGDLTNGPSLAPPSADAPVWVRIAYAAPATIQGLTLALETNEGLGYAARIEAGDDGQTWRQVADMPKPAQVRRFALAQQTISFAPVTARYFRLLVRPDAPIPVSLRIVERASGTVDTTPPPSVPALRFYRVHELAFHALATVNEFEKKAGFAIARDNYAIASTADAAPGSAVDPAQVVNLTDRMRADGTLDWTPPPGHWAILRLGYSLTGTLNHPATTEATGLEVDKLNRNHVHDYLEQYLDTYQKAAGPVLFGAHGLTALTVDSTEVGAQNWSESILEDFRRLRGYDPTPWLPALTGVAVRSPQDSDKFLWDFRRTINQLLAENHYGEIAAIAKARGLTNYTEALEDNRPTFGDDIEMRRFADIPMAAMWTNGTSREPRPTYVADIQGAASVANVYGRPLVAAESLTSAGQPWAYAPRQLKPVVDMEFVLGVNRVVIHTSVHQPVERPPGLSLNAYGQFFNRLESWADEAGGWVDYIARCSWLLQQGHHAADIAYFYGEEAPLTGLFGAAPVSDVSEGHGFDFVAADAVQNRLSVDRGDLVTASGMRYRLLYLGGSSRLMSLPVLRRLRDLVGQGAVLAGRKPEASPSLADDPAQFRAAADQLFDGGDGHNFGKGRVFSGLAAAFAALDLPPDFSTTRPEVDTEILSLHRHLADGELYFLSNRLERPENFTATFRVAGLAAEIWNPETGEITRAATTETGGRSAIALTLPAYGSAFVVFRKQSHAPPVPAGDATLATLGGPWTIAFQQGRGAPGHVVQDRLQSWSESADPGIKYFSGNAVYRKSFSLPALAPGARLTLDLGEVREVAEVSLNGKRLGTAWTPPFALDITSAARPGRNVLTVKLANLWVNRLIGDAQPGAKPTTFTTIPTYRADAPLRPSGLLGPVVIHQSVPPQGR